MSGVILSILSLTKNEGTPIVVRQAHHDVLFQL
jgi:hypothetical protein